MPANAVSPLRVLVLVDSLTLAGSERLAAQLAVDLQGQGHAVAVDVLFDGGARARLLTEQLGAAGLAPQVHGVGGMGPRAVRSFRRRIRQFRPDVVQAVMNRSALVATVAAASLRPAPPVVLSRHSLVSASAGGLPGRLSRRLTVRLASGVIANADAVLAESRQLEKLKRLPCVVIPNGVSASFFETVPPVALGDLPVVTMVANLREPKDQETLLQGLALAAHRGCPTQLVLVGSGEKAASLKNLAAELGVELTITGLVPDVRPYLAATTVYVHSSKAEGMPVALLEAAASGQAIVATDVGGVGQVLAGVGRLVPPGDPAALAAEVCALVTDPNARARLSASARERARQFGSDKNVAAHVQFYRGLPTVQRDPDPSPA